MIDAYVADILHCKTVNQFHRIHIQMEVSMAPAELCAIIDGARERNAPFGLVLGDHAHPAIRRIFELTGLHDVFPIFTSRAEAQAGLSGQATAS